MTNTGNDKLITLEKVYLKGCFVHLHIKFSLHKYKQDFSVQCQIISDICI